VLILLGRIALAVALLVAVATGVLAWRLASHPLALPWLAERIGRAASGPDRGVTIDGLLLSWGGFSEPGAAPLRLRLTGITAVGGFGAAELAQADVALALMPLLGGRIEPDTADLTGLRLHLSPGGPTGAADGGAPPGAADIVHRLASPSPDRAWARLRHLHVHDVAAEATGVPGRITRLDVDLDRPEGGGIAGTAEARLRGGTQEATLTLAARVEPDGTGTVLRARLTPVSPAALAGVAPQTAALAALDAPVTLSADATLGPALNLLHAEADIAVGAGTIRAGRGTAPLVGADARLTAAPDRVDLRLTRLDTAASPAAPVTRFSGHAAATRAAAGYAVAAALDVDQVAFADLPALWPEGTGGPGTRPWITQNVTAGRLTNGHVEVGLTLPADLSDVALNRIAGRIEGHDATVHWLRPVPPLEHAEAVLTVTDPDVIDIAVSSAVQAGGPVGAIRYQDATIHLTGIAGNNQFAEIHNQVAGPLPDLLAVLNNPRIQLLSKRPVPMRDPAGDLTARVHVGRLPLRDDVKMDDLVIDTTAHVEHTHLGGIVAGHDLSDGTLDLVANNDGLSVNGTARLAGFPSTLTIGMDFRAGPPTQVQESAAVRSTVAIAGLAAVGIDAGQRVGGAAEVDTTLAARRDGRTDIGVTADLSGITVALPRVGMTKARGQPGSASVRVVLDHDHLAAIEALRIAAPDVSVTGHAMVEAGHPVGFRFDRLRLGDGTDLTGSVRITGPRHTIAADVSGPSLDLSPVLGGAGADRRAASTGRSDAATPGQPWTADVAVERLILGPGRRLERVRASAESDGAVLRRATLRATVPGGSGAEAAITPDAGGRRLVVSVGDTGALLRAADVTDALIGGRLRITGRWSGDAPAAPLAGVVEMTDFRVRDAPAFGRVLQALTVYGLVELARGPGLGFTRLVAPFGLEDDILTLRAARAFSPSLGFTARGSIDLRRRVADLSGTVIPAYFFNSLLGRVPLVGRLFTSEKGGGLFAASVKVTGSLDDLSASVNPLSAVTPGFLRGLLGFDRTP
jgi:hypothetical protein